MPKNPTENLENLSAIELLHKLRVAYPNCWDCDSCVENKIIFSELEQRIIELEFNSNEPCACLITEQKEQTII